MSGAGRIKCAIGAYAVYITTNQARTTGTLKKEEAVQAMMQACREAVTGHQKSTAILKSIWAPKEAEAQVHGKQHKLEVKGIRKGKGKGKAGGMRVGKGAGKSRARGSEQAVAHPPPQVMAIGAAGPQQSSRTDLRYQENKAFTSPPTGGDHAWLQ